MGAYSDYIDQIKASLSGQIPIGGTFVATSPEFGLVLAQQVKGGFFSIPTLEVLADLPLEMLEEGMSIVVRQHERPGGSLHPRTRYYLKFKPNQVISEIPDYKIFDYWAFEQTSSASGEETVTTQYAPNYNGSRPLFLPAQISSDAYQAGYPTTESYNGGAGDPGDIIWEDDYDPLKNHAWFRQRIGTQPWGIPVSISSAGDYEDNQYIDVIFRWVAKGGGPPARPVQPDDYNELPAGWSNTPGEDYDTNILTQDLYRSQVLKNPYGVPKGEWELPILISNDPLLVRYGNQPGSTDYLNATFWRPYYTPGLDTYMATRPNSGSSNWTVTKIDNEAGEYADFVFKAFPINISVEDLEAAIPTLPVPIGGDSPNDCSDAPPSSIPEGSILYISKSVKYSNGSFKTPWSLWKRFDGLDTIQAVIEETPGSVFYQYRNTDGDLVYDFETITLAPKLFKGPDELTDNISEYRWYRGETLIVFDETTRFALNLGVELNSSHQLAVNLKDLLVSPGGVDVSQQYKVGIIHNSRAEAYEDTIQLRDAVDDGSSMMADIEAVSGLIFKNQTGLYRFNARFYLGGVLDNTNVVFSWSIKDSAGNPIEDALRDSGGASIGDTDVVAASVYVQGSDIDQRAYLVLKATWGEVERDFTVTLIDVQDAAGNEILYWGSGSTFPGAPTDFDPRTLTKAEVLALDIGYTEVSSGAWYFMLRINGSWEEPVQIRSESARPNGGIVLQIYKNIDSDVDPVPVAPSVPGSGSIIPAGWTSVPTEFTGGEDATYVTSATFLLRTDVDADPTVLTRANYNPLGTYGAPKLWNSPAEPPAVPGDNGWSPVFAIEADGERRVVKLVDWVGGSGTPPVGAGGSNSYVGASGLTTKAVAIDVRGPSGAAGVNWRPQHVQVIGATGGPATPITVGQNNWAIQIVYVTNSHSEPRWFRIMGEVGFTELPNSGAQIFEVSLYRRGVNASIEAPILLSIQLPIANWNPATYNFTLWASNLQRVDNNAPDGNAVNRSHVIRTEDYELIGAGQTRTYLLVARCTNSGGSGQRSLGRIVVTGL